ncbi:GvpL/GvpF family gas vesicle protein [Streptomyces sp. NEAU-W12]|uniref:GvpL/GvpF family gas vesicle protein n=1 Tax=Streptomyces sp. NEAU-W12 TaxID=2994668 RepID=UPI00224A8219|nr:GvpL/GvpF family gas vesicle protein [Streptomyces sp. NEAU-W12]MCX2926864.1 GvpL/GvpF family gas vesicle protein [Streptomyces sp. NEAU-W12]
MTGLRYVYAICRPYGTPLQAQLSGVAGDPPRLLPHHGLVAVVSHVPEADFAEEAFPARREDPGWLTAVARAHQGVVDALTTVTTPLPLRLGSVFPDDSGVRTMMEAREEHFLRTLDRLEGRVEWGVRVFVEEPAETSAVLPVSPRQAEVLANRLFETLSGYAEDSRLHASRNPALHDDRTPGRGVLDAAFLVPRAESEKFVERVDRAKGAVPGIRVDLTGPWAAYSFAGEGA